MAVSGHILIVDDEVPTLKLLGMAMERVGYRISAAQNVEQAVAHIDADRPDLAVLDVMLPGVSGLDMCRLLRSRRDTANLPIILLSAKGEVADRIAGLEAGADEYLVKPIDTGEFLARVGALLERTRARLSDAGARAARLVSFIGAQGGVGTTSMVANLGVALALDGVETRVVELRGYAGGLPLLLGLKAPRGASELIRMDPRQITPERVGAHLLRHASGLQAWCAPEQVSTDLLEAEAASAILAGVSRTADLVLVDLPSIPTPAVLAAVPLSQTVILVVEPVRPSVERAGPMARMIELLAASGAVLKLLVNSRAPIATPAPPTEISERVGWPVLGAIPPAPDEFLRAANMGRPVLQIQTEGLLAQALRQVATAVRG